MIKPENLGNPLFRQRYQTKYAYGAGSMYKGIGSKELVVKLGKANLLGHLGTGGLKLEVVEEAIQYIQANLAQNQPYGVNLLHQPEMPELEMASVELFHKYKVRNVEAAAYMQMTPSIVYFRLKGIYRDSSGEIVCPNQIIAKISRPEVAQVFMNPAPEEIVRDLCASGKLSAQEAELSRLVPLSNDLCVEADSGGHTDQGVAYALMPAIQRLRDELYKQNGYKSPILVGAAGGIGAPEAAAAAFIMGADFILTGSINQCTVEAGNSDAVKDILQTLNVQDTTYAPAGDMFELGAKVQVARKGLLFPPRANKLYDLYRQYESLDQIDAKTIEQLELRYFKRKIADVWEETKQFYQKTKPEVLNKALQSPKQKNGAYF